MASRIGLAMRSIHDDDLVSEIMGINVRGFQVFALLWRGFSGFSGAYMPTTIALLIQYFSALLLYLSCSMFSLGALKLPGAL